MATSQEPSAVDSPKPIYTISTTRSNEEAICCVAWLPGDRLVTGSFDRTVQIWNLTDGTQEGTSMIHGGPVGGIVTTTDGRIISWCHPDGHLNIWNADTQELMERPRANLDYGRPKGITLSQNEELLATCHDGGFVFWEMVGTLQVRSYIPMNWHDDVGTVDLSPNGLRLAVCCDGGLLVFDVESGVRIFQSPTPFWVYHVSWSLDGDWLFCGGRDQIRCFNFDKGESVREPWTAHTGKVNHTSLSPDGKWLAIDSPDRIIRFWDAETGNPAGKPLPHEAPVFQIAFSRSGEFLASLLLKSSSILIWRVPWWDDQNQKTPNALLDMSAVVLHDASGPSDIPDLGFLDVSPPRRPVLSQTRLRENPSSGPPRIQDSARSRQWWKRIPRLVFLRSHSIYTGPVPPRIYVASWENVDNSQRSQSLSSSEENSDDSSDTPSAGLEPEVGELEVGCCGFLPRRQPPATVAQGLRQARSERSSRSDRPPTTENADIPIPASTHTATQDILELSAVVRSPNTT